MDTTVCTEITQDGSLCGDTQYCTRCWRWLTDSILEEVEADPQSLPLEAQFAVSSDDEPSTKASVQDDAETVVSEEENEFWCDIGHPMEIRIDEEETVSEETQQEKTETIDQDLNVWQMEEGLDPVLIEEKDDEPRCKRRRVSSKQVH